MKHRTPEQEAARKEQQRLTMLMPKCAHAGCNQRVKLGSDLCGTHAAEAEEVDELEEAHTWMDEQGYPRDGLTILQRFQLFMDDNVAGG